jgi:hypothetical protein
MSGGAVCPSCGVAIVPGYVRCPKCRKPLPKRASAVQGGTTIEESSSRAPALAVALVGVVVVGGAIAFFAMRKKEPAAAPPVPVAHVQDVTHPEPQTEAPVQEPTPAAATIAPRGPSSSDIAADLERALKKQRLWATVSVIGVRAEVRSNSCGEKAMVPMLDGAAPAFKASGLTKLRCVEESGRVVSERDL